MLLKQVLIFGTATTFGLACVQSKPDFLRQTVASPAVVVDCNQGGLVFGWDALWLWNIYGIALQTPPCGLAPTLDKVSLSCIKPPECRPTCDFCLLNCLIYGWEGKTQMELLHLWLEHITWIRLYALCFAFGCFSLWLFSHLHIWIGKVVSLVERWKVPDKLTH